MVSRTNTSITDGTGVLDQLAGDEVDARRAYLLLDELGLSDGLPVVAPDRALVGAMLATLGKDPDDVRATVPPLRGRLTAGRLAPCAILAGCDPEHVPALAAAVSALADPALNALGVLTTTSSAAMMASSTDRRAPACGSTPPATASALATGRTPSWVGASPS